MTFINFSHHTNHDIQSLHYNKPSKQLEAKNITDECIWAELRIMHSSSARTAQIHDNNSSNLEYVSRLISPPLPYSLLYFPFAPSLPSFSCTRSFSSIRLKLRFVLLWCLEIRVNLISCTNANNTKARTMQNVPLLYYCGGNGHHHLPIGLTWHNHYNASQAV